MTATTTPRGHQRSRARSGGRPRHEREPRPAHYVLLLGTIGVLVVIGVVMVLSASSVVSLTSYGNAWHFFVRQLVWTLLGVAAFAFVVRIDYHRWSHAVRPILVVSGVLLALVLVPKIGIYVGGSRRWLGIGTWRFQPSELAKFALVLFAADLLARRADELHDPRRVLRPLLFVLVGFGALVCLEPDLDSTVLLAVIVGSIMVAGGLRGRHLALIGGSGIALAAVLALAAPYRRARVLTFLHPTADASNTGYQIVQSLIALGSGGVDGVGLGAGRSKWLFLPNAHTDFIFAVIGEELGLIGTLTVLGLFVAFAVLGIRTALRAPDRYGMLLATGVTVWVVAQAAVNIGGVTGLLPVSGIPLPFVSFGGSSLVFTMVAAAVLANVAPAVAVTVETADTVRSDVLITGGGTGGHVYPALAVADELVRRGHNPAGVRFVGARRGLEATAVPAAGYGIDLFPGRGIRRSLSPRALLANVGAIVGLGSAFVRAIRLVGRRRPRVVLGVGGYASAPCVVAARLRRVPAVVHEQNAAPGIVNRLAVRLGAHAAASLPDTALRGAVLTGNPVRAEIASVVRDPITAPALIVVVGGSLGARTLNDATLDLYDRWRARTDVSVRHISGARDLERCTARLESIRRPDDGLTYALIGYEEDMPGAYTRARVFMCRAGAVTCAELTVTGTPAILVPLPGAPADHQTCNANALAAAGAAVVIGDAELDGDRLAAELTALLDEPSRLDAMSSAARVLGRPDAAARVADLVEATAGPGRPS